MKKLKKHMKNHASHLFDLYWCNGAVFDRLPRKDREVIMNDYNDLMLYVNDCPCVLCMFSYLER